MNESLILSLLCFAKLVLLSLPAVPSTLQQPYLCTTLSLLAVFSFLCSIYDAIKVQFLVLEHFSNILQHVLCYYPPRPGMAALLLAPHLAHLLALHVVPVPTPFKCTVYCAPRSTLPYSALPCRTFSLNLFHLTWSHFHPSQACSHSRSSTLEQCSCWHFEQ